MLIDFDLLEMDTYAKMSHAKKAVNNEEIELRVSIDEIIAKFNRRQEIAEYTLFLYLTGKKDYNPNVVADLRTQLFKKGYRLHISKVPRAVPKRHTYQIINYYSIRKFRRFGEWPCGIDKKEYNDQCGHWQQCAHGRHNNFDMPRCLLAIKSEKKYQEHMERIYERIQSTQKKS